VLRLTRYAIITSLIAALLGCPSLLGQSGRLAGSGKKVIGTEFQIKSDFFEFHMKKDLPHLERELSDELAQLGNDNLTFLDWKNAHVPQGLRQASAMLVVYLEGRTSGTGEETWLRVEGQRRGQVYHFDDQLVMPLYSPYQDPPVKAETLKRDVRARLQSIFSPGGMRDRLMGDFLSHVPISNQAVVLEKHELLAIPLSEKVLAVAAGSEMLLALNSQPSPDLRGVAKLQLAIAEAKLGDEQLKEQIQCTVSSFDFGITRVKGWHREIPAVFKNAVPNTLTVSMIRYIRLPYHCTQRGMVICAGEEDL